MTLKTHKPKISFDMSPDPMVKPAEEFPEDAATSHENMLSENDAHGSIPEPQEIDTAVEDVSVQVEMHDDLPEPNFETIRDREFDRMEWERRLTEPEPLVELVSEPEAVIEPEPAIEPEPVIEPVAAMAPPQHKHARLAALGQMAPPPPSFLERNGPTVAIAGVIGVTFVLGLGTAMWMFSGDDAGREQQATFSAPMTEPSFQDTPTRALTPDMTDVSNATTQIAAPAPDRSASDLTAAVLAGLQPQAAPQVQQSSNAKLTREALEVLGRNKIRMLREGVLADLYEIETYVHLGVTRVRLRTVNAPLVNDYASDALLKAMVKGEIEMSKSLITPEGDVDVETMMFSLVQTDLRKDHSSTGMAAANGMSRKIFAASVARTRNLDGKRVYDVQPGDSLAYIALQFFGNPMAYKRILDANPDTLQSPERIQIGQRLVIPS